MRFNLITTKLQSKRVIFWSEPDACAHQGEVLLQERQCVAWQQPPGELSGVVIGQQSSQRAHGHFPYQHQQQLWSPP